MRLPNGFGSVHKLSGNRRKPYRVRKTTGWIEVNNGNKRQTYINIGYFESKEKALNFLTHYNENPYDIQNDEITFKEIYKLWSDEHYEKISPSAIRMWKAAYNHSKPLDDFKFKNIKVIHLEKVIKEANVGDATKVRMKSLFNMMYKYAMKHEIVDKNYASLCDSITVKTVLERRPFDENEIQILWANKDMPYVDLILINIYSGWRPTELITLNNNGINLEERIMKGGMKTSAGIGRIVPIHDCIYELVVNRYAKEIEGLTYFKYRLNFNKIMKKLKLGKHCPHDARHTFITKAKTVGMNEYIIKRIVGHAIQDITENVYTHRTLDDLRQEMKKIKK